MGSYPTYIHVEAGRQADAWNTADADRTDAEAQRLNGGMVGMVGL
jgi:hypothetical protein